MEAQLERLEVEASPAAMTISPSSTHRAGSCALRGAASSGK